MRRRDHETGQNPPTFRDVGHRCAVDPDGLGRLDLVAGARDQFDIADPRWPSPRGAYFAALNTLQIYLWIAVFNAIILISWARYQQRRGRQFAQRRAEAKALSDQHLSESFSLAEGDLEQLRRPGVLVIHNDDEGGVAQVTSMSRAMWKNRGSPWCRATSRTKTPAKEQH